MPLTKERFQVIKGSGVIGCARFPVGGSRYALALWFLRIVRCRKFQRRGGVCIRITCVHRPCLLGLQKEVCYTITVWMTKTISGVPNNMHYIVMSLRLLQILWQLRNAYPKKSKRNPQQKGEMLQLGFLGPTRIWDTRLQEAYERYPGMHSISTDARGL